MGTRILIVEDNPTNMELMSYLLQAFGYDHATARDGLEAVAIARRENPDLIICDIQLPFQDGYQVVRTLRKEPMFQHTPMIAVTALAMMGDRDKVLASGFNGYIAKPIQAETFVAQVEEFLAPGQRSAVRLNPNPTAPDKRAVSPRRQTRGVILAVDDNPENISLTCGILEPFGYRVVSASGVREAFETVRRATPDLILCDVHLLDGNGFDLLEMVRGEPEIGQIPFVLISSSVLGRDERIRAAQLDTVLIIRPIDSAKLVAEIEAHWPAPAPAVKAEDTHGDDSCRG